MEGKYMLQNRQLRMKQVANAWIENEEWNEGFELETIRAEDWGGWFIDRTEWLGDAFNAFGQRLYDDERNLI